MTTLTEKEALEILWLAKAGPFAKDEGGMPDYSRPDPNWCDRFVYATLKKGVSYDVPREPFDPPQKKKRTKTIPAGARVLVTMASRFGDVGIRAHHLVPASNGYDVRVMPEDLEDWSEQHLPTRSGEGSPPPQPSARKRRSRAG
jgi:hypothetical protein